MITLVVEAIEDSLHSYYSQLLNATQDLDLVWTKKRDFAIATGSLPEDIDKFYQSLQERMRTLPFEFYYRLTSLSRTYISSPSDMCLWCGKSAKRVGEGVSRYCQQH